MGSGHEVTRLLQAIGRGERAAPDELLPLVYGELRRLARSRMAREKPGHTLTPTALVHEAYLRLTGGEELGWENRGHFFAAAAEAMRRILIERARRYSRDKHGGGMLRIAFRERLDVLDPAMDLEDLLALDEAMTRLEAQDESMGRIVKLRYFAGLTVEETALALEMSRRTVERSWTRAKAWLYREMTRDADGAEA